MSQDRFDDPIVAEIHRTREKLFQECEGDIEKLMDHLAFREKKDRTRVLSDLQIAQLGRLPRPFGADPHSPNPLSPGLPPTGRERGG